MSEIRFAGYGGQGIIRSGIIVGKGASIFDNKYATMNQSFGPEARGGACSSQVVLSDTKVLYPYVTVSDVLVAMSQEGYDVFEPELSEQGLLLIDEDLVKLKPIRGKIKMFSIPSTRLAEELGNRIFANVVMLGFFTAVTKLVSKEGMEKAVADSVPERFVKQNLRAFQKGFDYFK
ncbi:MAG TPA: pyruvate ferredoxin oxidoreductase [Candidatus Cloacimonetes bacterium]|nr:pyruvate ferredoxin oxidoreductase [Candidatus Cloacimonadota bacterium]